MHCKTEHGIRTRVKKKSMDWLSDMLKERKEWGINCRSGKLKTISREKVGEWKMIVVMRVVLLEINVAIVDAKIYKSFGYFNSHFLSCSKIL